MNNVVFYLSDVAKTWYINHEGDFNDWDAYRERFSDLFGRLALRIAEAQHNLMYKVQQEGESYSTYLEGVD